MRLLISVVRGQEVAPAVEGGADIIDVKNPREGSLGASTPDVIRRVRNLTPQGMAVSAAIGDVPNLPGMASLAGLGACVCGIEYVKVGLLGIPDPPDAVNVLRQICQAVRSHNPEIQIIATGYADAHKLQAIPPSQLPAVAQEAGVDGCMLDTARKDTGTLRTNLSDAQLRRFVEQCHGRSLLSALAGSLAQGDIPFICATGVDIVGVRSAACQGDRINGEVDSQKVRRLKELIAENASPPSVPWQAIQPAGPAFPR